MSQHRGRRDSIFGPARNVFHEQNAEPKASKYAVSMRELGRMAMTNEPAAAQVYLNRRKPADKIQEGDAYNVVGSAVERFNPAFTRFNDVATEYFATKTRNGGKLPEVISVLDRSPDLASGKAIGYQHMDFDGDNPYIIGPVIGRVGSSSVKILVETNKDVEVTMTLIPCPSRSDPKEYAYRKYQNYDSQRAPVMHKEKVMAEQPTTFNIGGLNPDTKYTVILDPAPYGVASAGFRTGLPIEYEIAGRTIEYVFTQGNFVYQEVLDFKPSRQSRIPLDYTSHGQKLDLWQHLYERTRLGSEVKTIFHIGNNLPVGGSCNYGFVNSLDRRGNGPIPTQAFSSSPQSLTEYYRKSWSNPWTKHVLANCGNVFHGDELDFGSFARYGIRTTDKEETDANKHHYLPQSRSLRAECTEAYGAYQKQLSIATKRDEDHDFRYDQQGAVGFMFLDTRTSAIDEVDANSLIRHAVLGRPQYNWLCKMLSTGGGAHTAKCLVVVMQQPLGCHDSLWHDPIDPVYQDSTDRFLHRLFRWRSHDPCAREVVIVTPGGITGGHVQIWPLSETDSKPDLNLKPISQLIVGPIGNPYSGSTFGKRYDSFAGVKSLGRHYYQGHKAISATQYGILELFPTEGLRQDSADGDVHMVGADARYVSTWIPRFKLMSNCGGAVKETIIELDPTGMYRRSSNADHPDLQRRAKVVEVAGSIDPSSDSIMELYNAQDDTFKDEGGDNEYYTRRLAAQKTMMAQLSKATTMRGGTQMFADDSQEFIGLGGLRFTQDGYVKEIAKGS